MEKFIVFFIASVILASCNKINQFESQDDQAVFSPNSYEIVHVCFREKEVNPPGLFDPATGPFGSLEAASLQEICVSNLEGSKVWLTNNDQIENYPSWSPDGNRIVYVSDQGADSGSHVFIMDRDGTNIKQVTTNPGGYKYPKWNPATPLIAVHDWLSNSISIFKENGELFGVVPERNVTFDYDWSPDGTMILFEKKTKEQEKEG